MNTLLRAEALKLSSVSIPAISSGIFGFPKPKCAEVLFDTVERFIQDHPDHSKVSLRTVRFTNFDSETTQIFQKEFLIRYAPKKKETSLA
jgi:O-acetyl-ADP-ribose deacetylase (regulator of RNase III)